MRRPGLSRIEVAILLAMLAVLAALTLSGVQRVREAAARMSCSNNLKQIGIATQSYHDAMQRLPPMVDDGGTARSAEGMMSVFAAMAPFIEADWIMYSSKSSAPDKYHGHSSVGFTAYIKETNLTNHGGDANQYRKVFHCPSDLTADNLRDLPMALPNGTTGYYATGCYAANGLLPWGSGGFGKAPLEQLSLTVLFAERPQVCRASSGETVYNLWGVGFYSPHMPAFAALAPASSPRSWTTGQAAPVFPLEGEDRVRIGRADSTLQSPDFEFPSRRIGRDGDCDPRLPGSPHRAGLQVGMADGSVRVYSYDTTPGVFWLACHPGLVGPRSNR